MTQSSGGDRLAIDVVANINDATFRQIEQAVQQAGQQAGTAFGNSLTQGAQQGAQNASQAVNTGLAGASESAGQAGTAAGGKLSAAFGTALAGLPALAAGAALAVGAAAVGGLAAVTNMAAESSQNVSEFQAQLGVSAAEAERLGTIAEGVFGDNWTGSLTEAAAAVTNVRREIKGLAESELQSVTGAVVGISETFGEEQGKIAAAVSSLMSSTGMSAQEATDFIARGFQKGLNSSGDFLDTLNEYAPQFEKAKIGGGELFSLLETGAAKGALGTDKVADAFKEFGLTVVDVSKDSSAVYKEMGLNQEELVKGINNGSITQADAFEKVSNALADVKGQADRTRIGAAIFGGAGEDFANGLTQLDLTKTSMKDLAGGVDDVNTRYNSFGALFQGVWRQVQVAILPVGKEILGLANDALPEIKAALAQVVPVVTQVVKFLIDGFRQGRTAGQQFADTFGPQIERALVTFRPALEAIGPLFKSVFGLIVALWETRLQPVLTAIAPLIVGAVATIGNTLSLIVRVITGVANTVTALLRGDIGGAVKAMSGIFEDGVVFVVRQFRNMASTLLGLIKNLAPQMADAAAQILRGMIRGIESGAGNVVAAAKNMASGIITGVRNTLLIKSPSRVMEELGKFTAEGFVNGIASQDGKVKAVAQATAKSFITALSDLKNEKALGKIDLSTYVATLEQVKAKLEAQVKTVKEGTPAYTQYLSALTKVTGELNSLKGKSTEAQSSAKSLTSELAKNRAELEKNIANDAWTASLERMSIAQLKAAQATARSSGEATKYNSIKSELERREAAATAATERATAAAKAQADQLASNQKTIRDGLKFEAYVAGLDNYSDAQLNAAKANAYAAGDAQKFNSVMAEQRTRLEASKAAAEGAAQALSDLNTAQINAANSAYTRNPQAATDSAFRQSFGAGDVGLIRSLAAVTGLTVAQIRADVDGALADAKRFAPDAAAVIERVWQANLEQRRAAATEEKRLNTAITASYAAESDARLAVIRQQMTEEERLVPDFSGMAAELTALGRPMDDLVALAQDYAAGTDDAAVAARAFIQTLADEEAAFARRLEMANDTRDRIVENYRAEQDAADDAAVTVEFLTGQLAELAAQGADARSNGFREYLTDLAAGTGQAAVAATELLANFDKFWTAAQFNQEQPGVMDDAPAEARRERVLETLTAEQVAWRERTREVNAAAERDAAYAQALEGLTLTQLDAAKAQALQNGEMEKYAVLQAEILRLTKEKTEADKDAAAVAAKQVNGTTTANAFEKGKSSGDEKLSSAVLGTVEAIGSLANPATYLAVVLERLNIVGTVMEGLLSVIAEPLKQLQEPLRLFGELVGALMVPSLKLLAAVLTPLMRILVAFYDAVASFIKGITFGYVDITRDTYKDASAPAPAPAAAPSSGSGNTTTNTSNSVINVPTTQVTVIAAPAWEGKFGGHVDRFGRYVDVLTGTGISVRTEPTAAQLPTKFADIVALLTP